MGEDYIEVLTKYADRIKHVHLKDIRTEIVKRVKDEHLSFLQGVRLGAFTVPGDGAIDFEPIFEILDKANYKGWLIVEAEQDPSIANPLEYAKKARAYIKEKTNI
jgi:inosose dehydratase